MTTKLQQFEASHSYKDLLKKHTLNTIGFWEIRGADTNCDFGGFHHMPVLGHYSGKLSDIINFAVELPGFWSWGPGDIRLLNIVSVDHKTNIKRLELLVEKDKLTARLEELEQELHDWS